MASEVSLLLVTAITIALLHTLTGPDHYVPFIALSRSRKWTLTKTIYWTILCGCGHVWSSVLLGLGGAALGWSISKVSWLQGARGGIAGWVLLLFGLAYAIWGSIRMRKNSTHKHFDLYNNEVYVYEHTNGEAVPMHERHRVTPWILFVIFVLGPCEPMIPLLYFPAAENSLPVMFLLIGVYTFFTLAVMLLLVISGYYSVKFLQLQGLEKYMHALSGVTIFICGAGMLLMGW